MTEWTADELAKAKAMIEQKDKERGRPLTNTERKENLKRAFAENDIPGPWKSE